MTSKWILLGSLLAAVAWSASDVVWFGRSGCSALERAITSEIGKQSHLKAYMDEQAFPGGVEQGTVTCTCDGMWDKKITLTGNVVSDSVRQQFADIASDVARGEAINNLIQVLNVAAIDELRSLLAQPPTDLTMNYQIQGRGIVVLTGDLPGGDPNSELKPQIGQMIAKISGVRGVVNHLGRELASKQVLRLSNIYFDFNQWKIRPQSAVALNEVAQKIDDYLATNPAGTVRVEGHTDSIASVKYNLWLSKKRAEAVRQALAVRGLDSERLTAAGKGEGELLIKPDNTPEKRAENRRIEFHFE